VDDDAEFLQRFVTSAIAEACWSHRDHVRMAYLFLRDLPFEQAVERMRSGIRALLRAQGIVETPERSYHETITVAWARLIQCALQAYGSEHDFASFIAQHRHFESKTLLRLYYSRARISSADARRSFVEPDLAPLP
jgi:hypothetical protein